MPRIAPALNGTKAQELIFHEQAQSVSNTGKVPSMQTMTSPVTPESKWIMNNIRKRECKQFVPIKDGADKCKCNHTKASHSEAALRNEAPSSANWDSLSSSQEFPTDAFGEIEFDGMEKKAAKFVRISRYQDMDNVLHLLMKVWQLEKPNLVISVTGGAKNFKLKQRLSDVFSRGLMKAVRATGAWIITGGTDKGVMKHVGEAVRKYTIQNPKAKVVLIGIAPWGTVANRPRLIHPSGLYPARYRPVGETGRGQTFIDSNHTHFFLVDDGSQQKFAVEIPFRAKLEQVISQMTTNTGQHIPIVSVVLEGGAGTLETVKSAIITKTPAVVVKGSGRAADILAYAYQNTDEKVVAMKDNAGNETTQTITVLGQDLETKIAAMVKDEFGEKNLVTWVNWVKECVQNKDMMTVFELDGRDTLEIDSAILSALMKGFKGEYIEQLKLALAWNQVDVARCEIFTPEKEWNPHDLNEIFHTALVNDRVEFVQLLMSNTAKFNLSSFLTPHRLARLYNEVPVKIPAISRLHKIADKRSGKPIILRDVAHLIQDLIGDFYVPLYEKDSRYHDDFLEENAEQNNGLAREKTAAGNNNEAVDFDDPKRELFLWAALLNRREMADFFFEEGKEPMAAALCADILLRQLATKIEDTEIENCYIESADHFRKYSVGILNECYVADQQRAQILLVHQLTNFGDATAIMLAVEAMNRDFLSHSCCQLLLTNIWTGEMTADNRTAFFLLGCVLPFAIPCIIKFWDESHEAVPQRIGARRKSQSASNKQSHAPISAKSVHVAVPVAEGDDQHEANKSHHGIIEHMQCSDNSVDLPTKNLSLCEKITFFYQAPVITFILNCVSYLTFLSIFSYVMLCDFYPPTPAASNRLEYLLIFWVFTLFVEEWRQLYTNESRNLKMKFFSYIDDPWNILDLVTIGLFTAGMALRFVSTDQCSACFDAARVLLNLNVMTFFFRILHIFSVHRQLGPKLVMIGKMTVDMFYFIIILVVFVAAYGVASHAIMYPNSAFRPHLLRSVFRKAYFQMYGELMLDEIEIYPDDNGYCGVDGGSFVGGTLSDGSQLSSFLNGSSAQPTTTWPTEDIGEPCPTEYSTWFVPVMLAFYVLFTNVLMFNLLIAMFSNTFEEINKNADIVWRFQRYHLVLEYYNRPPIVPPLIFVAHVYLLARWVYRWCKGGDATAGGKAYRQKLDAVQEKALVSWENMHADEYIRRTKTLLNEQTDQRVRNTEKAVQAISCRLDTLLDAESQDGVTNGAALRKMEERLDFLEQQSIRTSKQLDWIVEVLQKQSGGKQLPDNLPDPVGQREAADRSREESLQQELKAKQQLMEKQLDLHVKSRTSPYPGTDIKRFPVPDDRVPWQIYYGEYAPISYTSPEVLQQPSWADQNLMSLAVSERTGLIKFNSIDDNGVDRRTTVCATGTSDQPCSYEVRDGLPLNPRGRTGMTGRGALGRWGPNLAGDPVVTRWALDEHGTPLKRNGKRVLQFIGVITPSGVRRNFGLPGGIRTDRQQPIHELLKAKFINDVVKGPNSAELHSKLDNLFGHGQQIYSGYSDDPRNTDNAWIETTAILYHDDAGHVLHLLDIRAGTSQEGVRWVTVSNDEDYFGSHKQILKLAAERLGAHF